MSNSEKFNWEDYDNGPKTVIFNAGKAGELTCTAKLRNTTGELGPNGNPLPLYMLTLSDANNVDEKGAVKTLEVAYYSPKVVDQSLEADLLKRAKNAEKANMLSAKALYEAMVGGTMPMGSTPQEAFTLVMEACVAIGEKQVRAFVEYAKTNKPHRYLTMRTGFKKGILANSSTEVFEASDFMNRPPAPNTESTTTTATAAAGDDLPF